MDRRLRSGKTLIGSCVSAVSLCLSACDVASDAGDDPFAGARELAAPTDPIPLEGEVLQRHEDLLAIQAALEAYAADHGGGYPVSDGYQGYVSEWGASLGEDWIPELTPDYLPAMPRDPANSDVASGRVYIYFSNGSEYKLVAHGFGECSAGIEQGGVHVDPMRKDGDTCWAYGVWSPGGRKL